ncbi:nose resistant to fluoxetine protein 6-like [Arctopsyche grandis]|uniref:nose resistant to fluoxetine protein 6-like n=1 Tax=Arctopsyche grandis TaxID=121162 RepID=UPI00406D6D48
MTHKSFSLFFNPYINRTQMAEMFGKPWAIIGRTAIVYTDSFLLISGFLTARCLLKDLHTYNEMRFTKKLISRLFRLIPGLLTVILFCTYILPDLGSGPQWETVINEHSRLCKRNMWMNLMFIHNFMGFENMCLTHTHQLGIDMQLFIFAPLAVGLLWYLGTRGMQILLGVSLLSTALRFVVAIRKELSMIVYCSMPVQRFFDSANYSYILPSHRATIYTMGILLAYFMTHNQSKINLTKSQVTLSWSIAAFLGLSALIGPQHIALLNYKYDRMEAAYYSAFAPIVWGSFISWSIWACNNNCAGKFGDFLSWGGFKVCTKIAYGIYLTQFPIFFYNVGIQRHSDFYRLQMMINIPELCAILISSTVFTLLIEIPFNNIHKLLFKN